MRLTDLGDDATEFSVRHEYFQCVRFRAFTGLMSSPLGTSLSTEKSLVVLSR